MKFASIFVATLFVSILQGPSARAEASIPVDQLRETALRCAVQPYAVKDGGGEVHGRLRSTCAELKVEAAAAQFQFQDGNRYVVSLQDSEDSDGGDLNDVTITAAGAAPGESLVVRNVLAFGDPVLAVLGGNSQGVPEVQDQTILH